MNIIEDEQSTLQVTELFPQNQYLTLHENFDFLHFAKIPQAADFNKIRILNNDKVFKPVKIFKPKKASPKKKQR